MAAPRWASLDRSCDQYGMKLRADHGGSSPGGVLPRVERVGARDSPQLRHVARSRGGRFREPVEFRGEFRQERLAPHAVAVDHARLQLLAAPSVPFSTHAQLLAG